MEYQEVIDNTHTHSSKIIFVLLHALIHMKKMQILVDLKMS